MQTHLRGRDLITLDDWTKEVGPGHYALRFKLAGPGRHALSTLDTGG